MSPKRPASCRAGFTLIELLAASAIMTVLILIIVSLSSSVLGIWTQSVERLSANQEARVAMDRLASDLEFAVPYTRGRVWLQVQPRTVTVEGIARTYPRIIMVTNTLDRPVQDNLGNPIESTTCVVVYDVRYQNPFSTVVPPQPVVGLYRGVVDGKNTFEGALAMDIYTPGGTQTLSNYISGSAGVADDFFTYSGDAGKLVVTSETEAWYFEKDYFLGNNIVDFSVTFHRQLPDDTIVPIASNDIIAADRLYVDGAVAPGRIVYADLAMTVVPEEGMTAYRETAAFSSDATGFSQMVSQYGFSYTRRVYLVANAAQELSTGFANP